MVSSQIYDKILGLPLFQGMNKEDFEEVLTTVKFGFYYLSPGKVIKNEGDKCDHIIFLTDGKAECVSHSDNYSYNVTEIVNSPEVFQPERLFGLMQFYTKTFRTKTECHFITIDKNEVILLSDKYYVFRLNLLNIVSTRTQRLEERQWKKTPLTVKERVLSFFQNHTTSAKGEKIFKITMTTLANEINDSRLDVSMALHELQKDGFKIMKRGELIINQ